MAFSSVTIHPHTKTNPNTPIGNDLTPTALSLLILSAFAAKRGTRSLRKMKRHLTWNLLKEGTKSFFSKKQGRFSDRLLIYILLAVIVLVLLLSYPVVALILALVALLLILAKVI